MIGICYAFIPLLFYALQIKAQATVLEIWEIQGDGLSSPYVGQAVTTNNNIVTAVGEDRFYIQTPGNRSDNNPLSSDGLMVYTGNPPAVQAGDLVDVSGRIQEFFDLTEFGSSNLSISILSSANALPPPAMLDSSFPSKNAGSIPELERVEGMLVSFAATASGPSNEDEILPLVAADERPFREPGIAFPGLNNLPLWDGNPEIFWFDPDGLTAVNNPFLGSKMLITATAILHYENGRYIALPLSYSIEGMSILRPVRDRQENEFTIGSLNTLRLFSTSQSYTKRLKKMSKYIIELLKAPDILALQEVGSLNVLQDLKYYIELSDPQIDYTPYLEHGQGDINIAFMVRKTVRNVQVSQLGKNEFLSLGGILHDRPPFLLEGEMATEPPTPIKVLNVHLRSLLGIEGSNAGYVRTKRHEQAVSVANMVNDRQGDNLVVVGDLNAFQFTDGYVDVVNQIAGQPSLGAQFSIAEIVAPPLNNHLSFLAPEERYSFVFRGNAELIDHCLSTTLQGISIKNLEFARANADNSVAFFDNENIPHRSSDHDGFVLFLEPDNLLVTAREEVFANSPGVYYPNPYRAGDWIEITTANTKGLNLQLIGPDAKVYYSAHLPQGRQKFSLPAGIPNGIYFLKLQSGGSYFLGKIVIHVY